MLTLHLTLRGQSIKPSSHERIEDLGDALTKAFAEAGMGLKPRVISALLSLMFADLRTHKTWRWVGEEYEIFVIRDGP